MGKNIDENISKNIGGKYSQKLLDHAKQCYNAMDFYLSIKIW